MIRPFKIVEILVIFASVAGVLPLYPHLENLPKVILPIFALSGIIAHKRGIRISPPVLTIASIGLFAYYAPRFGYNNVAEPASNLLASFLAIRIAGERTARAYLQTCTLSIFCLAASSLYTLGPAFLLSLLLLSTLVISTLIILTFYEAEKSITLSRFEIHSLGKLVLGTTVVTIPLMFLFFIILPRTQFPLWNTFVGKNGSSGGIAERVEPGLSESIEPSRAVAFRAESIPIDNDRLYWRCVVFNSYTSGAWVRNPPPKGETGVAGPGKRVQQTIFPESVTLRYLPALDPPLQLNALRSSTSGDLVTSQSMGGSGKTRYEAVSIASETIKARTPVDRKFYLRLPTDISPGLYKIAAEIASRAKADSARLTLAREFFISSKLRYATRNLPTGKGHLDRFLFEDKKGHCEYFATSLALIMRSAGVPARVVGGYYGGTYNELGGYYVVSEEMAHAWTEILIDGEWKRVDPSRWSTGFADISMNRGKGFIQRISTLLDTFTYYWNVTVITYDLGSQIHLARNAGDLLRYDSVMKKAGKAFSMGALPLAAALIIWLMIKFRKDRTDSKLALQFISLSGYESLPEGKGLIDIAEEWGNNDALRFATIYSDAIYNDRRLTEAENLELRSLLRSLKTLKYKG
jgi:transglutaminase-like putative cysteine protease